MSEPYRAAAFPTDYRAAAFRTEAAAQMFLERAMVEGYCPEDAASYEITPTPSGNGFLIVAVGEGFRTAMPYAAAEALARLMAESEARSQADAQAKAN
jgi:hypothetical protein